MAWKLQLSKFVFDKERHLHNQTPPRPFLGYEQVLGVLTRPFLQYHFCHYEKIEGGKKKKERKRKKSAFFGKFCKYFMPPLSSFLFFFILFFFIFFPLLTFTRAKQQEGPLMNVADRHGYGSEMRQKAIMVGHSGEGKKKKKRRGEKCTSLSEFQNSCNNTSAPQPVQSNWNIVAC